MSDQLSVRSADGTLVGATIAGSGTPLVLVHGSTADQSRWAPLVPRLQDDFSLVMIDRRGRGASSTEAADYAIEREVEDLLAVLEALGPQRLVFGHSYGATVVLGALDRLPATGVLLYEPPFDTANHEIVPEDQLGRWRALLERGDREGVLADFYRHTLGFDEAAIDALRPLPIWQARIAAVHTIVREAQALRFFRPRSVRPSMPVRILMGELTTPALTASTQQAADAVRGCELVSLPGQAHVAIDAAPDLIAEQVRQLAHRAETV